MKGVFMNKMTSYLPFVYAPQTNKKIGAYGVIVVVAFIFMLLALYAPEIETIGNGIGLNYDLIP